MDIYSKPPWASQNNIKWCSATLRPMSIPTSFRDSYLHNSPFPYSQIPFFVFVLSPVISAGPLSPPGSHCVGPIRSLSIVPTRNAGAYGEVGCTQGCERGTLTVRHMKAMRVPLFPQTQASSGLPWSRRSRTVRQGRASGKVFAAQGGRWSVFRLTRSRATRTSSSCRFGCLM